jgi:hypothetical protein
MSTLATTNIKHPSSASNNIVLDSSGNVVLQAGSASTPALQPSGDTNTGIFFPAADTIAFAEGGVESARIDSSGRLLVGTSTSTTVGAVNYIGRTQIATSGNAGLALHGYTGGIPYGADIVFTRSRSATIDTNTIMQSGDQISRIWFAGANGTGYDLAASIGADIDGTPGANDMPGRLVFSTTADGASSPTERMRINEKGEAKFSTTGSYPSATTGGHQFRTAENLPTLTVNNAIASGFADTVAQITLGYAANTTTNHFLYCNDTSAARMYVRTNGGIGNYQSNDVNLSDRNLKKDISPATTTWDCIKQWEIVNYRYKDQPDEADLNLGVIAQQVAESCPEVVTVFQEAKEATEDKPAQEECLGVKEQQMMWMAIKALQEAQVRIETLEAEVAALKAQ